MTTTARDWRNPPTDRQPAESPMPFYHHVQAERRNTPIEACRCNHADPSLRVPCLMWHPSPRPAVRWVKVAWLGSLLGRHIFRPVRDAAKRALTCIDNDDARGLVECLRIIEAETGLLETSLLARGAADAVERAIREGER